jgi:hypothetical protein
LAFALFYSATNNKLHPGNNQDLNNKLHPGNNNKLHPENNQIINGQALSQKFRKGKDLLRRSKASEFAKVLQWLFTFL